MVRSSTSRQAIESACFEQVRFGFLLLTASRIVVVLLLVVVVVAVVVVVIVVLIVVVVVVVVVAEVVELVVGAVVVVVVVRLPLLSTAGCDLLVLVRAAPSKPCSCHACDSFLCTSFCEGIPTLSLQSSHSSSHVSKPRRAAAMVSLPEGVSRKIGSWGRVGSGGRDGACTVLIPYSTKHAVQTKFGQQYRARPASTRMCERLV
jgi:hypothetical protein